jgi:hypothetical protein
VLAFDAVAVWFSHARAEQRDPLADAQDCLVESPLRPQSREVFE